MLSHRTNSDADTPSRRGPPRPQQEPIRSEAQCRIAWARIARQSRIYLRIRPLNSDFLRFLLVFSRSTAQRRRWFRTQSPRSRPRTSRLTKTRTRTIHPVHRLLKHPKGHQLAAEHLTIYTTPTLCKSDRIPHMNTNNRISRRRCRSKRYPSFTPPGRWPNCIGLVASNDHVPHAARPIASFERPRFADIGFDGPRGSMPGTRRPLFHLLAVKRRIIQRPESLLVTICRMRKPA